ncbi:protein of unknown function (plasmid) [Methylocella tundrae]|uniref:Uncharacterized protein n=1 Tax=Methylocella tundrae TaxID=227605 RepID=A0A4U8Z6L3_METTU|nr:protein of unknown function [Methylocella tundrae]
MRCGSNCPGARPSRSQDRRPAGDLSVQALCGAGIPSLSTVMTAFVQNTAEGNLVIGHRRLFRASLGEKIFGAQRTKLRPPRLHVEGRLLRRLQNDLVAEPADAHFRAFEPELLRQAHGLAAAMHEEFCDGFFARLPAGARCHDPPPSNDIYLK